MHRIIQAEIKKLHLSKIWILIIVGAFLPGVITYLSFLKNSNVTWLIFIHVATLIFNVQSLFTFSAFSAYIYAREYEENTIEVTRCYPYPRHIFIYSKLTVMLIIVVITTALYAALTLLFGSVLLSVSMQSAMLWTFLKVLAEIILMHFLLLPMSFLLAAVTRLAISGVLLGIINMCLCMMLHSTSFIQYIPPCIPFVLSDHLIGMNVMIISDNYIIHWSILLALFTVLLYACYLVDSGLLSHKNS